MKKIAEGFGIVAENAQRERIINETLDRLGGDQELIERYSYDGGMSDPEWDYSPNGQMREGTNRTSVRGILENSYRSRWGKDQFDHLKTMDDLASYVSDEMDDVHLISLLAPKDDEAAIRDRRRQELESIAGQIARKHNVKVNSLAFIQAINKEIDDIDYQSEQWNDGESRMERMGFALAEHGSARGSELFYDDNNYINGQLHGQSSELYEIQDWLAESCPLLWAQYQESQIEAPTNG